MPRKSEESAPRRKPSAASDDAAVPSKKKAATKAAVAKARSAGPPTSKKTATKKAPAKAAPAKKAAKKSAAPAKTAAKAAAKTSAKSAAKPGKTARKKVAREPEEAKASYREAIEDPIGDLSDGEGHHLLAGEGEVESGTAMMDAYRADTAAEAERSLQEIEPAAPPSAPSEAEEERDEEEEQEVEEEGSGAKSLPEPHLERLQKILSQAGIASRRHAEEMIVAGRVMVNGQAVTQLGAKADPNRDHIRVDGKLIQGAERHRTFVLNKPKGYVTTVSDPEGRPTVMQFFEKMRERLYPVGRLDYQSEGLLLMTNDGELANGLTRAAAGVEKTYLVKVSGQPTEEELDQLRSGVSIEREQAGSGRVRTAPASVRPVRSGQNPWYEVVLIEGRNREIRKMFQAIGHFVEKIRRVGYGPLVLDVEPGKFRELSEDEVTALRLTAEGKLKPRRPRSSAMLPKEAGRPAEERFERRGGQRGRFGRDAGRGLQPERSFRSGPQRGRPSGEGPARGRAEERRFGGDREGRPFQRREGQGFGRPSFEKPRGERPQRGGPPERFERPREDRGGERQRFERPGFNRPRPGRSEERSGEGFGGRPQRGGFGGERPRFNKPRVERPDRGGREGFGGEERRPRQEFRPHPERSGREGLGNEERRPRREFRPREEQGDRGERGPRPNRSGGLRIEREYGGERPPRERGEWQPRERRERPERPARREGGERPQRFGGGRPGGGGNRRPGFGGGPRRPGLGGRPGGGGPRRDRG